MKKLIVCGFIFIVLITRTHAGIIWTVLSESEVSFDGVATLDTHDSFGGELAPLSNKWEFSLQYSVFDREFRVVYDGFHNMGPHEIDLPSSVHIGGGLIINGSGYASDRVSIHHNAVLDDKMGHIDTYSIKVWVLSDEIRIHFTGWHETDEMVPEPSPCALLAGLGLISFAVLRRLRR